MDSKKSRIAVFGFDKSGFPGSGQYFDDDISHIEYIAYGSETRLDDYHGVIIPQGIFETFNGDLHNYDSAHILERQRQLSTLYQSGGWTCFLVGQIVDLRFSRAYSESKRLILTNTDLCKCILNDIGVKRAYNEPHCAYSRYEDFKYFVNRYGTALTNFTLPEGNGFTALVIDSEKVVGFEYGRSKFFLPFHTTHRTHIVLCDLAKNLSKVILNYRQQHNENIPSWLDEEFKFNKEEEYNRRTWKLQDELIIIQGKMEILRQYKSMLISTGDALTKRVVDALQKFFMINVDSKDEYKEDAKILNDAGEILAFVEIKGTNGGVQRKYINQVDDHRERANKYKECPGVLIINVQKDKIGIDKRLKSTGALNSDTIKKAKDENVLIIRTIDLLYLMKILYDNKNRKDILLKLIKSGGGWLHCTETEWKIETE